MPKKATPRKKVSVSAVKKTAPTTTAKAPTIKFTAKPQIKIKTKEPQFKPYSIYIDKKQPKIVAQIFFPFDPKDVFDNAPSIGKDDSKNTPDKIKTFVDLEDWLEALKKLAEKIVPSKKKKTPAKKAPKKAPKPAPAPKKKP